MKILTIGRHESNEIVVNDSKVSRNHLQIIQDDDNNYMLVDLNSTNGTFVNGQRVVGEFPLQPNDTIRIGTTPIVWQDYFLRSSTSSKSDGVAPLSSVKKHTTWYVVIIISALLIIGAIVFFFIYKRGQQQVQITEERERIETQHQSEEEQQRASIEAEREAVRARLAFEEAEKERIEKEKSIVELEKRQQAATSEAEKGQLGRQLAASRTELDDLKVKEQNANARLSAANTQIDRLEAANQKLNSDLQTAKTTISENTAVIESQRVELERLKRERLNLLISDFSELLKSDNFVKTEPVRVASGVSEKDWKDRFARAQDFEQKRRVFESLEQAIRQKAESAEQEQTETSTTKEE